MKIHHHYTFRYKTGEFTENQIIYCPFKKIVPVWPHRKFLLSTESALYFIFRFNPAV